MFFTHNLQINDCYRWRSHEHANVILTNYGENVEVDYEANVEVDNIVNSDVQNVQNVEVDYN